MIPVENRLLWVDLVEILWGTILSREAAGADAAKEEAAAAAAEQPGAVLAMAASEDAAGAAAAAAGAGVSVEGSGVMATSKCHDESRGSKRKPSTLAYAYRHHFVIRVFVCVLPPPCKCRNE